MAKLHIGADNGKAPIKWSNYISKNADEVIEEVKHYYQINPYTVMDEIESEKRYRKVTLLRYEHYVDIVCDNNNGKVVDIFQYEKNRVLKLLEENNEK
jgi:hypothetical protein